MQEFEFFRSGKRTDMHGTKIAFSESDLAASAQAYDPELHEAPLVVGHPDLNAPAYGWVQGIRSQGSSLFARPQQVDSNFAELVQQGRYKKISASFYTPRSRANPVPGVFYLRHIGFLGAMPPAVKGLQPIVFAENEDIVTLDFTEPPNSMDKEFEKREAELKRREAEIALREAALKKTEFAQFLEPFCNDGRLPPAYKDGLVSFMACLPEEDIIQFGEDDPKQKPLDFFKDFLQKHLPKQIIYGEVAGGKLPSSDPEALASAATEYVNAQAAKGKTVSYTEAVSTILRGGKA